MKLRLPNKLVAAIMAAAAAGHTAFATYVIDSEKNCTITGTETYNTNAMGGNLVAKFTLDSNAVFTATGKQFGSGGNTTLARSLVMGAGSKVVVNDDTHLENERMIQNLTLNGSAGIEVNGNVGIIGNGHSATTLTLNDNTLSLTRSASATHGNEFRLWSTTVSSGTIDVGSGVYLNATNNTTFASGSKLRIAEGGVVNLNNTSKLGNAVVSGAGMVKTNSLPTSAAWMGDDWSGILLLNGVNLGVNTALNSQYYSTSNSYIGMTGVTNVSTEWQGTISANIYLEDSGTTKAWTYNNGSSGAGASKTLIFSGKMKGDGTLLKDGNGSSGVYNQNYTFTGDISGWTGRLQYAQATSNNNNSIVTFSGNATTINTQVDYTYAASASEALEIVLGDITAQGVTAYTINNLVKADVLTAAGKNIVLGSNLKADGVTTTHGTLNISKSATFAGLTLNTGTSASFGGTTTLTGAIVNHGDLTFSGAVNATLAVEDDLWYSARTEGNGFGTMAQYANLVTGNTLINDNGVTAWQLNGQAAEYDDGKLIYSGVGDASNRYYINNSAESWSLEGADSVEVNTSVTFNQANSYSGGTIVKNGTLTVTNVNALGTGPVVVNRGAMLELNTAGNAIQGVSDITLKGMGSTLKLDWAVRLGTEALHTALHMGNGSALWLQNGWGGVNQNVYTDIDVDGSATIYGAIYSNTIALNGSVKGAGELVLDKKKGENNSWTIHSTIADGENGQLALRMQDGSVTLTGTNTYTGGTILNAGTLTINNANALGTGNVKVGSDATLSVATNATIVPKLTGTGIVDVTAALSDISAYVFNGVSADEKFAGTLRVKYDAGNHSAKLNLSNFSGVVEMKGRLHLNGSSFGDAQKLVFDSTGLSYSGGFWSSATSTFAKKLELRGNNHEFYIGDNITTTISGALLGAAEAKYSKVDGGTLVFTGDIKGYLGTHALNGGTLKVEMNNSSGKVQQQSMSKLLMANGRKVELLFSGYSDTIGDYKMSIGTLKPNDSSSVTLETVSNSHGGLVEIKKLEGSKVTLNLKNAAASSAVNTYMLGDTASTATESAFSGTVALNHANTGANRSTMLIINDGYVTADAKVTVTAGATTNARLLAIGLNSDTVRMAGLHDASVGAVTGSEKANSHYTLFSGSGTNLAGNFTGSNRATYLNNAADGTVRTLEITGSETYSTNIKVDKNINLKMSGTGKQSFGGDMSSFNGSVSATAGVLQLLNQTSVNVQDLLVTGADAEHQAVIGVYTGADSTTTEGSIVVSGTLTGNSYATLNANLTMADGSTIAVRGENGLHMGSALTFANGGKMNLSEDILGSLADLDRGEGLTLFSGVDSFTLGGSAYSDEVTYNAQDYFNLMSLTNPDTYVIRFQADAAADGGTVSIFAVPEPTTATLSLLALAGLAARRRRK